MSEEQRIKYRKEWEEFVRQPCVNNFSENNFKYIKKYYYSSMILGYHITEFLFTHNLKALLKKMLHKKER